MNKFGVLKKRAEYLLSKLENGKFYQLDDLIRRFRIAVNENPGDAVIKTVASVIEQRALNKNGLKIISQAQIEEIYKELVGLNPNTKFREVLGDLLLNNFNYKNSENKEFIDSIRNPEIPILPLIKDSTFDDLFEKQNDKYDHNNVLKAQKKIELELKTLGFNSKVKFMGGNSKILIFASNLSTRNGMSTIYLPVNSSGDEFPTFFISKNGINKFNTSNLLEHIKNFAFDNNHMNFSQLVEKCSSILNLPTVEVPKELKSITANLDNNLFESSLNYPQSSINMAKKMIVSELSSMGFKNSQVYVSSKTNDGFICDAFLNTPRGKLKIEIPIEMNNNSPLMPNVFAKDDFIGEFNSYNIVNLASKQFDDTIISHYIKEDQLYAMSINDLKSLIIKSAANGDFQTCDYAMEVIYNRFDNNIYRNVVSDYYKILSGIISTKKALQESFNSNEFVKTPNSLYPIHKKLGLPANQLIRDENGDWHRKSNYNKKHDSFINSLAMGSILIED